MADIFSLLPPVLVIFACVVTLLGGFVKGAIGFAMPLIMVSGMGIFIDPPVVVACIVIPILVGNMLQVAHAGVGHAKEAVKEHWRYIALVCMMILISAQFLTSIPTGVMSVLLGVVVVLLCAIQLAGWRPIINAKHRRPFEWGVGTVAGTLGGLAGTWGPPTVLYLLALNIPRDKQMAVQGVIYGLGSVMLFLGHVQSGILNAQTWPLSAILVIPALLGMWMGFKWGARFDQDKFRRVTLWVLVIAGANLIRRGVMG